MILTTQPMAPTHISMNNSAITMYTELQNMCNAYTQQLQQLNAQLLDPNLLPQEAQMLFAQLKNMYATDLKNAQSLNSIVMNHPNIQTQFQQQNQLQNQQQNQLQNQIQQQFLSQAPLMTQQTNV